MFVFPSGNKSIVRSQHIHSLIECCIAHHIARAIVLHQSGSVQIFNVFDTDQTWNSKWIQITPALAVDDSRDCGVDVVDKFLRRCRQHGECLWCPRRKVELTLASLDQRKWQFARCNSSCETSCIKYIALRSWNYLARFQNSCMA